MRYHFNGIYKEEQRRGFVVTHLLQKDYDTANELAQALSRFMKDYNSEYCYGLSIGISEEPTLVE